MVFSSWPGSCDVTFTHSEEPLILSKTGVKRAFSELCRDVVPPCNLNPFLFNGHLQTAWTAMKYDGPPIHYKRRVFASEEKRFAGHFAVDFVTTPPGLASAEKDEEGNLSDDKGLKEDPTGIGHIELPPRTTYFTDEEFNALPASDSKPLLLMLHGLSGGSYETYLRHVVEPLVTSSQSGKATGISGGDWEVMVVNSRGCAGTRITTNILYNARTTWDIRQIVKWCRKTWPNRPLFGMGFSLGANMLTNYLGEEGSDCLLTAACVVANPWTLDVAHVQLHNTWLGREVYSKAMGTSMKKLFDTHADKILENKAIDRKKIEQIKHLYEFDREVQCPTWGYPTFLAYHRDASSTDAVMSIRVPTMALHAVDDPIACDTAVPYDEIRANPYVVIAATSSGGHLGWFEFGGARWHAKPAVNFLRAMAEVDRKQVEAPSMPAPDRLAPFKYSPMQRKAYLPSDEP